MYKKNCYALVLPLLYSLTLLFGGVLVGSRCSLVSLLVRFGVISGLFDLLHVRFAKIRTLGQPNSLICSQSVPKRCTEISGEFRPYFSETYKIPIARPNEADMTPKRTNKGAVPEPFTKTRQDDGILNFYSLHLPSRFSIV